MLIQLPEFLYLNIKGDECMYINDLIKSDMEILKFDCSIFTDTRMVWSGTTFGTKGGSNTAASAVNAMLYMVVGR